MLVIECLPHFLCLTGFSDLCHRSIIISSLNDDVIVLQVQLSHLLRALKSTKNAVTIVVRLTKKHGPCLSFEIHRSEDEEPTKMTLQDVPVEVQPIRRLLEVCEPELPDPQVKFTLPKLKVHSICAAALFLPLSPRDCCSCTLVQRPPFVRFFSRYLFLSFYLWSHSWPRCLVVPWTK